MLDFLKTARGYLSWKLFFIFVTICILIAAIVWVYNKYLVPKMNPTYVDNKEFTDTSEETKEAELIIFTVNWCPYCKKAMPVWRKFEEEYRRTKREEKQNSRRGVESNWTDRVARGGHVGLGVRARRGVRDGVGGAGGPQQKLAEYDQNSSRGILNDQLYSWTHGGQDGQGGDAVGRARDGGDMVEYDRN